MNYTDNKMMEEETHFIKKKTRIQYYETNWSQLPDHLRTCTIYTQVHVSMALLKMAHKMYIY